jgi:hypothetical protein
MKLLTLLYVFCLFYVFIPGNVIKLPIKTSKMNIILIHALVFSVILSCTYGLIERVNLVEGMTGEHKHPEYAFKNHPHNESKKPAEINGESSNVVVGGKGGEQKKIGGKGGGPFDENKMDDVIRNAMPKPGQGQKVEDELRKKKEDEMRKKKEEDEMRKKKGKSVDAFSVRECNQSGSYTRYQ